MAIIAAGQPAPEFSLARPEGGPFTRADLQGRRTLLVFYPFAFSEVCTNQLGLYDDLREDFAKHGVTLYGVSCDAVASQQAFKAQLGVEIEQLLVDAELLRADRRERERIEHEHRDLPHEVLTGEGVALEGREGELGRGPPGLDDRHGYRRRPSSRMSERYPSRSFFWR